jgi:hypothetical protein
MKIDHPGSGSAAAGNGSWPAVLLAAAPQAGNPVVVRYETIMFHIVSKMAHSAQHGR